MDRSAFYTACAAGFAVLLLYKLLRLRSRWSSPRLWALCAAVFFTALTSLPRPSGLSAVSRGRPGLAAHICPCAQGGAHLVHRV